MKKLIITCSAALLVLLIAMPLAGCQFVPSYEPQYLESFPEGEVDYLPSPPPPPPPPPPTTPMYIWVLIACGFMIAILVVYAFWRKGKVMAFASLVLPFLAIVVWAAYLADILIHSAITMEVSIFIVVILANILGLYFGIRSLKAKQGRGIATLGIVLNSMMMLIYVAAMWLLPDR